MNSKPLLSIAIPAYDRPRELEFSLRRFIQQIAGKYENEVEIVVSDDCSPDDSLAPVRRLAERHGFIRYRRYPENIGLERNLIACAEGCTGEFLWLFGDDDYLETDDAFDKVMNLLKAGQYDFYVFNRTRRSFDLSELLTDNWMELDPGHSYPYPGLREFCLAHGLISVIGFISVNIFRRAPFQGADATRYFGTMYPQLGAMVAAFHDRPVLLTGEPLICHRTQTREEKIRAFSHKRTEADFMTDAERRNSRYFSHPFVSMVSDLVARKAFTAADITQIPENTVTRGWLVDFLIRAVRLNHELDVTQDRETWSRTARFFRKLPLAPARQRQLEAIFAVRAHPGSPGRRLGNFFLLRGRLRRVNVVRHVLPDVSAAAAAPTLQRPSGEARLSISVITPSFNQGKYLGECLASVRDQTHKPIEHFVFDPGSKDDSRALAAGFPHVTLVAEPDEGQSDAVNKGFQRARGDIIGWLNSDDCFANSRVFERVIERFLEPDAPDIVYGGGIYIDESSRKLRDVYINQDPTTLRWRLQQEDGILQPALFMRRSVVEKVGLLRNDLHYCMDYEYWIRCVKAGIRFAHVEENFALARYHGENKTFGMRGNSYAEVCSMLKHHFGYVNHRWLKRYAEFLVEGHDGVLATAGNSGVKEPEKLGARYQELLAAYNASPDTWELLSKRAAQKGFGDTIREMKAVGATPLVPYKTIPLDRVREAGHVCYTVGPRRWAFDSRWKGQEIAKAHRFLKGRIAARSSDTCVIVGNGPSLNRTNLDLLKGRDVIVSNNAFLSKPLMDCATYLTVVNYLVAEQSAHHINRLADVSKVIPYWLAYCLNPGQNTFYVDAVGYPEFSKDMFSNMSWRHTVTFFNFHLAYGLGYRRVVLIGMDHNYVQPQGVREQTVIQSAEADQNHFHPDYFRGKKWQAADVGMMEEMYRLSKAAFEEDGREIINATAGGKLELFHRMSLEQALDTSRGRTSRTPQTARVAAQKHESSPVGNVAGVSENADTATQSSPTEEKRTSPVSGAMSQGEWREFAWSSDRSRATLELPLERDSPLLLVTACRHESEFERLPDFQVEIDGVAVGYSIHQSLNPKCAVAVLPAADKLPGECTGMAIVLRDSPEAAGAKVGSSHGAALPRIVGCVIPAAPALRVEFPKGFFRRWLGRGASNRGGAIEEFPLTHFDGMAYLDAYRDVADALRAGTVSSALDHYRSGGFHEGRKFVLAASRPPNVGGRKELLRREFDGISYLRAYPDVAEAVRVGKMRSAIDHYLKHGLDEGRSYRRVDPAEATTGNANDLQRMNPPQPQSLPPDTNRPAAQEKAGPTQRAVEGGRDDIVRKVLYEVQLHEPIVVEHDVDEVTLNRILSHIQQVWTRLGVEDPHWSVVSTAEFRRDRIAETIGRFKESGRIEAANLERLLARVGMQVPRSVTALEYGCGVARVTRWLAARFDRVVGVDVSENHLKEARAYLGAESVSNVNLVHVSRLEQLDELPAFGFLYSKIVLQHNPPPVIARILTTLCRRLSTGGVGVIQVPTHAVGYSFRVEDYLRNMANLSNMEMHVLPQNVVFAILQSAGCVPLEVSRDHLVTKVDFVSSTFVFQKCR
jgi:glycosyltransferase involved in cell wall biosynthesis